MVSVTMGEPVPDTTDKQAAPYDRIGILVSLICTIHCLSSPILLIAIPAAAVSWSDNEWFHVVFLSLASWAAYRAIVKYPHLLAAKLLAFAGLAMLALALVYHHRLQQAQLWDNIPVDLHLLFNLSGSICLIGAHSLHILSQDSRRSAASITP